MKTTIDKAGRVVIPAAVRARVGLRPGTELDVVVDDDGDIRLVPRISPPKFERVDGWWRATPTVPEEERTPIDVPQLIREERDRWPF